MPKGRVYKTKSKGAQEAHESIRPTSFRRDPDSVAGSLKPEELRLYRLIWQRALASQMAPKELETTTIELADGAVRAARVGDQGPVRRLRPRLHRGSRRRRGRRRRGDRPAAGPGRGRSDDAWREVTPTQHFTEPPPRFTEATLIKALEEHGIGRPSTYAATISTITDRGYVRVEERRLHPELVAEIVTDLLVEHFGDYVDVEFTARMEEELDEVARGERAWVPLLRAFYGPLRDRVDEKRRELKRSDFTTEPTDEVCSRGPPDGHPARPERPVPGLLAVSRSTRRAGRCPATSRRPRRGPARSARSAARARSSASAAGSGRSSAARAIRTATTSRRTARRRPIRCRSRSTCPKNKDGHLVPRRARRTGNVFWGCSNYPRCDFTTNHEPLGGLHDTDDGPLARKGDDGALPRSAARRATRRADAIVPGERYAGRTRRTPRPWPVRRAPAGGAAAPADASKPRRSRRVAAPRSGGRDARRRRDTTGRAGRGRVSGAPAGDRDRSRAGAVPPLPRRARRLAAHPARVRHRRRRLSRLAGRARHGLADARHGPTCAPTSPCSARATRARRSPSGWPPSARSTAGRPGTTSRRVTRGAPSPRPGCRAACRASSRSSRSTRLLDVVEADLDDDAGRRPRPGRRCASPWRCATGRSSRPPTPRACASASWPSADLGSLDLRRGEIRVLGKGRKERIGLLGRPAREALADYLEDGRPVLLERRARRRGAARRDLPEPPRRSARGPRPALPARPPVRARRAAARRLAAHAAPLVRDPPARRRRRPARRPGAARPREPGDDPDLHPRLARSTAGRLSGGPSAGPPRPDPVTRGRRARPRRDHRLGRVPRLARARLRPGRRHRQRLSASTELDAFFAAFRIPDLIFQLVAAGALSSALIPIVSALFTTDERAARLAGRLDRDQPDAHRPARARGRAVHPRAGHRPDHHARASAGPSSTRRSS